MFVSALAHQLTYQSPNIRLSKSNVRPSLASASTKLTMTIQNMRSVAIISSVLAMVHLSIAGCGFSKEGHGFEMYIYGQTNCGTGNHWEEFFGSGDNPACSCYNIASSLNDKVKSFVFTASTRHSINIYKDGGCKGELLGMLTTCAIRTRH